MTQSTHALLSQCPGMVSEDREKLERIADDMRFVADVSRSDLLLYARCGDGQAMLIAQARPHSTMPVHAESLAGQKVGSRDEPAVFRALRWGQRVRANRRLIAGGAPVIQEIWPVRGSGGRLVGALNVEANLIAHVRQKSRSTVFQRAVHTIQSMLLLGELKGVSALSPFREHDGLLVVDDRRVIRYASGIATEHYRKLWYLDSLVGRHLSTLNTADNAAFTRVVEDLRCSEQEVEERPHLAGAHRRTWIRKGVPLIGRPWGRPWWRPWEWFRRQPVGVLFAIHDATEERHKERELKIKSAMIQEVHHRVKNNLQTVAAVLRMEIRRSSNDDVRRILKDSVARVLSMAVVHEYLSREEGRAINVREVTQRIIQQTQQGVLSPDKRVRILLVDGYNLYLPARQATACALVINELLQNAVDHAFKAREDGTVSIDLVDEGDQVRLAITDDGGGLPHGFAMEQATGMGLQIVQTLVQDDLQGSLVMEDTDGVRAIVTFPKNVLEGEGHWNEQE